MAPFLPTRVALIFGPRGVAKRCPEHGGLRGDGDPATPIKPALGSWRSSENWQQRGLRAFFNSLLGAGRAFAEPTKGSSIPGREIFEDLLGLRLGLGILSKSLFVEESDQLTRRLFGI